MQCRRCNYVSFDSTLGTCRWFHLCRLDALQPEPHGVWSRRTRVVHSDILPPLPTPEWHAPLAAAAALQVSGYFGEACDLEAPLAQLRACRVRFSRCDANLRRDTIVKSGRPACNCTS